MKYLKKALLILFLIGTTLPASALSMKDTLFDRAANEAFAFGADISWLSQMESWGTVYRDDNGVQKDLMVILKEHGINAVRFRVWVNPSGGWSGKADVLALSKRAHKMGFKIMIDFHYSDSWADPGKQTKPAAWSTHTLDQLKEDVYNHTYDILHTLKQNGITPAWVQVGNETKRGMLWPEGSTDTSMGNFAQLVNSGYNAVKAVDSTMQVIVHLPDGDENSLFRWMFDGLKKNGAKWDIIGMSAYPHWAHLDSKTEIDRVVANMKDMMIRYKTKVMVVETGYDWDKPYEANNFLVDMMDTLIAIGALGNFYWEPESMSGYNLGAWDQNTKRPTIAMDAFLGIRHTDPASVISVAMAQPLNGAVFQPTDSITLTASANHKSGTISKVYLHVNNLTVAVKTTPPYTHIIKNPGVGNHTMYATAVDSEGYTVKSTPVTVSVGQMTLFQESTSGYCGITDNLGTIDTNHAGYTGAGFINCNNAVGTTVNWTVEFAGPGRYTIEFRYAGTSARPGTLVINGQTVGVITFPSTGAWTTWGYSSLTYDVTKAGAVPLSLTANVADGLPNIDYMSVRSVGNTFITAPSATCLPQPAPSALPDPAERTHLITAFYDHGHQVINVTSPVDVKAISLYRTDGTLLLTKALSDNRDAAVNVHGLGEGVYLLVVTTATEACLKKVVISTR